MYTEKDINKCCKYTNSKFKSNRLHGIIKLRNIIINSEDERISNLAIEELYNVAKDENNKNSKDAIINLVEIASTDINNISLISTEKLINIFNDSNNDQYLFNELQNIAIKTKNIEIVKLITDIFNQTLDNNDLKIKTLQYIKLHTINRNTQRLIESKMIEIDSEYYELNQILARAISDSASVFRNYEIVNSK